MSRRFHLPLAILVGLLVRVPFWVEALRTPVDGDTAIVGLMARHLGESVTLWGQPYGSPLEAALAAPFVAALGPTTAALRLFYFLLGLALIAVAYALGRELDPAAALPAALLLACPPPYFLVMAALPAPLYPTTLVLCGLVLVSSLRAGARLAEGGRPLGALTAAGALAGLALWTHPVSFGVVAACAGFLVLRARGRRALLLAPLAGLVVVTAPLWLHLLTRGHEAVAVVVSRREEGVLAHAASVAPQILLPLGGLLGTHAPLIPDDPEHVIRAPAAAAAGVVLIYGFTLISAARQSRGRGPAALLLAAATLGVLAFPFPVRSGPGSIRFLTPVYLCVAALVAWAPAARAGARRAVIVVLSLACLHLTVSATLLAAWRDADRGAAPFLLPDLLPLQQELLARGVRRAYASYGPAYRLTYESGERIVASPPWNERFRHYPLPYLDEVRFAKGVAWILTPSIPSDLPAPAAFEAALGSIGGRWRRTSVGPALVYDGFVPPFSPEVVPLPGAGAAGDGDPATAIAPAPDRPTTFTLSTPQRLDAVTLVAGLDGPGLPRSMDVEVSADGRVFETVARRRRRGERADLRWVNGQPQYVLDNDLIAVPLGGRQVAAIRITPVESSEPWSLGEILLHPVSEASRRAAWDEWLDPQLSWAERQAALAASPRRDREDWYWRMLLAARRTLAPR